jgi:hypothetical protein
VFLILLAFLIWLLANNKLAGYVALAWPATQPQSGTTGQTATPAGNNTGTATQTSALVATPPTLSA